MIKELFKRVTSFFSKKPEVKETRTVVYAQPIKETLPVMAEVIQMKQKPKKPERMTYAEMKANQQMIDSYYNNQSGLRLVA